MTVAVGGELVTEAVTVTLGTSASLVTTAVGASTLVGGGPVVTLGASASLVTVATGGELAADILDAGS